MVIRVSVILNVFAVLDGVKDSISSACAKANFSLSIQSLAVDIVKLKSSYDPLWSPVSPNVIDRLAKRAMRGEGAPQARKLCKNTVYSILKKNCIRESSKLDGVICYLDGPVPEFCYHESLEVLWHVIGRVPLKENICTLTGCNVLSPTVKHVFMCKKFCDFHKDNLTKGGIFRFCSEEKLNDFLKRNVAKALDILASVGAIDVVKTKGLKLFEDFEAELSLVTNDLMRAEGCIMHEVMRQNAMDEGLNPDAIEEGDLEEFEHFNLDLFV